MKIVRPLNKYPLYHQGQFASVIHDVLHNNLKIDAIVADNPKRAFIRNSMQFSSLNGCEYCFTCGVSFRNKTTEETVSFIKKIQQQKNDLEAQITSLDKGKDSEQISKLQKIIQNLGEAETLAKKTKKTSHVVWPANTRDGPLRTKEEILEIVQKIESGNELSHAEKKGIKGRSIMLDIEHFDFVISISTEYMHLICLGGVKRLLELCFTEGESRPRITKSKLVDPSKFNELMKDVKVFHEFSRRARKLDLAVMKAQEMRNILLFFFTLITECLTNEKQVKLWEMLAFMVRACILPEKEYINVKIESIKYCMKNFYILYQQLFGCQNCTYSIHVFCSHLLKMREAGPLTETSAFRFEAFYAELRNAFQPGTTSVLKQMFQKVLLKRMLSKHVCQEKIFFREKDTSLECNSMIYCYKNNVHVIYKIQSIQNNDFICNQMGNHPVDMPCTSMLNWSSVGVYRKGGLSSENIIVKRNQIDGKVIRVQNLLITCPANILREK